MRIRLLPRELKTRGYRQQGTEYHKPNNLKTKSEGRFTSFPPRSPGRGLSVTTREPTARLSERTGTCTKYQRATGDPDTTRRPISTKRAPAGGPVLDTELRSLHQIRPLRDAGAGTLKHSLLGHLAPAGSPNSPNQMPEIKPRGGGGCSVQCGRCSRRPRPSSRPGVRNRSHHSPSWSPQLTWVN